MKGVRRDYSNSNKIWKSVRVDHDTATARKGLWIEYPVRKKKSALPACLNSSPFLRFAASPKYTAS
jgi:hypothetical protein